MKTTFIYNGEDLKKVVTLNNYVLSKRDKIELDNVKYVVEDVEIVIESSNESEHENNKDNQQDFVFYNVKVYLEKR